jgi:hypothetical protein
MLRVPHASRPQSMTAQGWVRIDSESQVARPPPWPRVACRQTARVRVWMASVRGVERRARLDATRAPGPWAQSRTGSTSFAARGPSLGGPGPPEV